MQEKQEMGLKAESSFFKGEFWSYMLFVLPPQAGHCPADVSGHGGLLCISRDSEWENPYLSKRDGFFLTTQTDRE